MAKATQKKSAVAVSAPVATTHPADILFQFLVWGKDRAPARITLNLTRKEYFDDRCRIAAGLSRDTAPARAKVYSDVFGRGAEYAVLCTKDSMAALGTNYPKDAPHANALRYLAACIALGRVPSASQDTQGGQEAPLDPVKPAPTRPSGGAQVTTQPAMAV